MTRKTLRNLLLASASFFTASNAALASDPILEACGTVYRHADRTLHFMDERDGRDYRIAGPFRFRVGGYYCLRGNIKFNEYSPDIFEVTGSFNPDYN